MTEDDLKARLVDVHTNLVMADADFDQAAVTGDVRDLARGLARLTKLGLRLTEATIREVGLDDA